MQELQRQRTQQAMQRQREDQATKVFGCFQVTASRLYQPTLNSLGFRLQDHRRSQGFGAVGVRAEDLPPASGSLPVVYRLMYKYTVYDTSYTVYYIYIYTLHS